MENLAIFGGTPVKTTPYGSGMRFGDEELQQLKEALEQNTLFYWYGNKVKTLTKEFAKLYGVEYCVAASSGTAAIHVALGAVGVTAGDEVITSPITDMGSLIGILYQNAVPVFADLDPNSYTLDPRSVEEKITEKTKAIVVVHLAGSPTDMDPIMDLARRHGIKVIEDCAQSYLANYKGRMLGTIGDIGCFSLNDYKQISAGDGGLLITNDQKLYEVCHRFADKNYQRLESSGRALREVPFLAPNYRMNELTGAVGLAQIRKLPRICDRLQEMGDRITQGICDLPGVLPPKVQKDSRSTYWFYMFRIEEEVASVSRDEFSAALAAEGIHNQNGYIPSCVYEYGLFDEQNAYNDTHCPFNCPYYDRPVHYAHGLCPEAEDILRTAIRFDLKEFYTDLDIGEIISAIRKVSRYFYERKRG